MSARRWYLRVCPCGAITSAGTPCAGFPGAWDDELEDFSRSACLGEVVEVEEVAPAHVETQEGDG